MKTGTLLILALFSSFISFSLRTEILLDKNWKFSKGDFPGAVNEDFDDSNWEIIILISLMCFIPNRMEIILKH